MQQTFRLKLSLWDLAPQHLAWVLMRKDLHITRLPRLGESFTVQTHPAGFERIFTLRDYRVYDEQGQSLVESATTWILMNTQTRRPARMPAWVLDRFPPIPESKDCLSQARADMPEWQEAEVSRPVQVGWHDLDFNLHLNNTQYWRLLLDTLPRDILADGEPELFRIHYLAEAGWDEELRSERQTLGSGHFLHRLVRVGDKQVLARAESSWR